LVGCADHRPNSSPTSAASFPSPNPTSSPSPSAEDLNLRKAERAVFRFWRVIDRHSADPDSDLTEPTTVAHGSVAAAILAKNLKIMYRTPKSMRDALIRHHDGPGN
jgi:hypothetical protein